VEQREARRVSLAVPCVKEVVVHGTKAREVRESEFRVSGGAPCQVQAVFDDVQGSVLYVLTWRWREADSSCGCQA
jgi:hypothetical protein